MLTPEQQAQIARQIEAYEHMVGSGTLTIPFGTGALELDVEPFVASPEIMNSGVQVVEYLVQHPELVKGKIVTDMGTGTGIIGVAAGKLEAKRVFMPDIDERAVLNAQINIQKHRLQEICEALESDLFSAYGDRPASEVQIFNHPFFSEQPVEGKPWTRMMLGGTELLGRYFSDAPKHSTPDARYVLPWLTLAGHEMGIDNDPGKRAEEFGFEVVSVTEQEPVTQGIQRALFKIYELRYNAR